MQNLIKIVLGNMKVEERQKMLFQMVWLLFLWQPLEVTICLSLEVFLGSIATATADTLASEIGVLQDPVLLTTFKKVPPGTDGGISFLGTAVGIVGAGIIGFCAYMLGIMPDPYVSIKIAIISGTVGCFMDSLLGAVFERRDYLNNEHVNLLATLTGAIVGILCVL